MKNLIELLTKLKDEIKGSIRTEIICNHSVNEIEILIHWKDDFHATSGRIKEKGINDEFLERFILYANNDRKAYKEINHKLMD